jgi:hypothetical protein
MRIILSLCAVMVMCAPVHFAYADDDADAADIVILSVKPRSPDVKPVPMSIPVSGHDENAVGTSDQARRVASGEDSRARR